MRGSFVILVPLVLILAAVSPASSSPAERADLGELTLSKAIELAVRSNPAYRRAQGDFEKSLLDLKVACGSLEPYMRLDTSVSGDNFWSPAVGDDPETAGHNSRASGNLSFTFPLISGGDLSIYAGSQRTFNTGSFFVNEELVSG